MKRRKKMILTVSLLTSLALFAGCTAAAAENPQLSASVAAAPTEAAVRLNLDEIKAIAYAHAGVSESEASDRSYDFDDGRYEIEFEHGGWEYDYHISPDGSILFSEKTPEPTRPAETKPAETTPAETKPAEEKSSGSTNSDRISAERALSIALSHAGVSEPRDRDVEWDDGRWEVSFESGRTEYEYHISADGSILFSEKTPEPTRPAETKPAETKPAEEKSSGSTNSDRISAERALSIALSHAGVSESRDRDVEWDDGRWEVSFESGRDEYEYHISADGSILHWEKETDD